MKYIGICSAGLSVSSCGPYSYHLTTNFLPFGVSTWRITWKTTYSCGTLASFLVAFLTCSTVFSCCRFLCRCCDICVVLCRLSVTCALVCDTVRWSMQTVFCMPSFSIVTVRSGLLSTLYGPDARRINLLYQRFDISSTESDAIAASWKRSTSS